MPENSLFSLHAEEADDALFDPACALWARCEPAAIDRFWSGKSALRERGHNWPDLTHVRSLWSNEALFFYVESWFDSLNVNPDWGTGEATRDLADKDVIEVFLRPEGSDHYYEFEVSPLGQWLDVCIMRPRVEIDADWQSSMAVRVISTEGEGVWRAFLRVPYQPMMAPPPGVGAAWRLNLFRIAGLEPARDYLAWRPTFTERPDFHVPWAFGHLIFLDGA